MNRTILSVLVLAVAAPGQWSALDSFGSLGFTFEPGPVLVATETDTFWVAWRDADYQDNEIRARTCVRDSLGPIEAAVTPSVYTVFPLSGVVDTNGYPLLAYYDGDYPTLGASLQDSWGIYTVARTNSGWNQPELALWTRGAVFPSSIHLARGRTGILGMALTESRGGINRADSVLFSTRTPSGWTPRRCLAPGSYPDLWRYSPRLTSGDSTEFLVAFASSDLPESSWVTTSSLGDSLVGEVSVLPGRDAMPVRMARHGETAHLVFFSNETMYACLDTGQGWTQPTILDIGDAFDHDLAVGPDGVSWLIWIDDQYPDVNVMARYWSDGAWSQPETVYLGDYNGCYLPTIASNRRGDVRAAWVGVDTGMHYRIYTARRPHSPGVGSGSRIALPGQVHPTILRSPDLARFAGRILDIQGRDVTDERRSLSPGVYFCRPTTGPASSVRKVVIAR